MRGKAHVQLQRKLAVIDGVLDHFPSGYRLGSRRDHDARALAVSASEAAHYEQLKRRERQSLVVGGLPDDVVAAIEAAEYGVDAK
jgi:hypothetical protein